MNQSSTPRSMQRIRHVLGGAVASIAVASIAVASIAIGGRAGIARADSVPAGADLVRTYCAGCHHPQGERLDRISNIRKTPEGWAMTLFRMRQVHGLALEPDVRDAIVRYLADTQGLAPEEARAGRFALERRPNVKDLTMGADLDTMCGRCHSLARSALQRRDADEWRKLANTHVGQWASIEYSASGRDRPWYKIATVDLPPKLGAAFPFASPAWTAWRARPPADLSGDWVVIGRATGGKDFYGTAHIERDAGAAGNWRSTYTLHQAGGGDSSGGSKAIVYTGYEWRGTATQGGREVREVFAVSADGTRIEGRWFLPEHPEDGGEWLAVRDAGPPLVLAVLPRALRTGSAAAVVVVGTQLSAVGKKTLSFGDGVAVANLEWDAHAIRAQVTASPEAAPGARPAALGGESMRGGALALYRQIDVLEVRPSFGIARLGGGRIDPVSAQFEALAATRLPNGELLDLGPVAADWSALPFDAEAKRAADVTFAGHFAADGLFVPAGAGPNPKREFSGNNVGNLTVVARASDGSRTLEGKAHLIVTVQRWNNPPIY